MITHLRLNADIFPSIEIGWTLPFGMKFRLIEIVWGLLIGRCPKIYQTHSFDSVLGEFKNSDIGRARDGVMFLRLPHKGNVNAGCVVLREDCPQTSRYRAQGKLALLSLNGMAMKSATAECRCRR